MEDFICRTVTETIEFQDINGRTTVVTATSSRDSKGYGAVRISVNAVRALEFNSLLEDYRGTARAVGKLLQKMADEPCSLPVVV